MAEPDYQRLLARDLADRMRLPNVAFLVIACSAILVMNVPRYRATHLVNTDIQTRMRIGDLERLVQRSPVGPNDAALELARLYGQAGEFPWAYDVLADAERRGGDTTDWNFQLGITYLQIGQIKDAKRILDGAQDLCGAVGCEQHTLARLKVFGRLTELLVQRGIDPRKDRQAAAKVLREVLRPTKVDEALNAREGGQPAATKDI